MSKKFEMDWTIQRILQWTTDYFQQKGISTPRLDAEVLLAHVLQLERIQLYVHFDKPLEHGELAQYRDIVRRRGCREPVAYITNTKEFYSLAFYVDRSVLIPRPETELLVDCALQSLSTMVGLNVTPTVLDIGTGSGAVLLAIGTEVQSCTLCGTDIIAQATKVAQLNAQQLGLNERTTFFCQNLFPPSDEERWANFELIVSNPPYIPTSQLSTLEPEIVSFEPIEALNGGTDGLDFYRWISAGAFKKMKKNGIILVEVGDGCASQVIEIFQQQDRYEALESIQDYTGTPRVVKAVVA